MNSQYTIINSGFTKKIFILFVFICLKGFSQKSEIIYQSRVKHNYASVGRDYYVENTIDTTKLLFMGTVKVISSNQDGLLSGALAGLKLKTKELNGNSYKLKSFILQDTTLTLLFDVYFASDKQVELIKQGRIKGKAIVFNNIKDTIYRELYMNKKHYVFHRCKHIEFEIKDKEFCLQLDSASREKVKKKQKANEDAFFYSVKLKNNTSSVYVIIPASPALAPVIITAAIAATALGLANKYLKPDQEFFSNISYNTGRVLYEIFPTDKQISLSDWASNP